MSKPLKTVEEIAEILYEFLGNYKDDSYLSQNNTDETIKALNNHYKELFESMMDNLEKTGNTFNDFELLREELAKELGTELSEHFNGEGEL